MQMSEMEQKRLQTIKENQERLKMLGLGDRRGNKPLVCASKEEKRPYLNPPTPPDTQTRPRGVRDRMMSGGEGGEKGCKVFSCNTINNDGSVAA